MVFRFLFPLLFIVLAHGVAVRAQQQETSDSETKSEPEANSSESDKAHTCSNKDGVSMLLLYSIPVDFYTPIYSFHNDSDDVIYFFRDLKGTMAASIIDVDGITTMDSNEIQPLQEDWIGPSESRSFGPELRQTDKPFTIRFIYYRGLDRVKHSFSVHFERAGGRGRCY